ncbi:hypothetical protein HHK36_002460 [Tetracentron sinense]|uniref:DUF7086 domain-containing protein n=1 Tax=Tetracentron sinense TaxID=13715 RepID=A0A834ZVL0_TETSI|nr:hypothetical protein HHK36_002460 [Tetracentron sinense]
MADEELNGKRKNIDENQRTSSFSDNFKEHPATPPPSPSQPLDIADSSTSSGRVKSDVIPAKYPWATTQRAHLRTLNDILSSGVRTIIGRVGCDFNWTHNQDLEFDLQREFNQVASFVAANKSTMFHRIPEVWLYPPRSCSKCNKVRFVRPIISKKKRSINWLFLLLGEMLGYCSSDQLKYFCKHSNIPHNGGRDELICLTYLGLCKQLDPSGPFDP